MAQMKSMTGYGRLVKTLGNKRLTIETKSLNSKQTDLTLKLPVPYSELEMEIRGMVNKILKRGKIYCQLNVEYLEGASKAELNSTLALKYIEALKNIANQAGIEKETDFLAIATRMPDVVNSDNNGLDETEIKRTLELFEEVFIETDRFRLAEGMVLVSDIINRIGLIEKWLYDIQPLEINRIEKVRERLVNEVNNLSSKINVDANRLEQELIFYLEKLDITEEKIRLAKHLEYFKDTLNEDEDEKGKKLGFITQEIGREINTIGSKANDASIQRIVVQMKDELEKIKEQLLNIL